MNKLLTVIIPVYNTEKYILRCLNSILHPDIDIVVIDDGSTDKSLEIISDYSSKYENIRVFHLPHVGAQKARLIGLKEVKTKYFGFVDSDDIINLENYVNLLHNMDKYEFRVGNGRMTVFLPDFKIPFNSRKWKKDNLDFSTDKLEFSNLTCSIIDKIWHIDCAPLFMFNSQQNIYEDLEVSYYVIAKQRFMLHSNDLIYNYCMRGLKNNSTSAIGLQSSNSSSLSGLLSAIDSMKYKFLKDGMLHEYEDELNSIMIKLVYQRIYSIFENKEIVNKKEMANLVFQILDNHLPCWRENKYFKSGFKECEYNDYLFYLIVKVLNRIYGLDKGLRSKIDINNNLFDEYDKRIILTKK